jgi:drug/metabolite transporter (DMT)-like permease
MSSLSPALPPSSRAILAALGAAVLFGASTPLAKSLLGNTPPMLLAGLLYLGSGLGLWVVRLIRDRGWRSPALPRREYLPLIGAIACGGMLGPVLLMSGLARTSASDASLLLNLEAVFTAALAWIVFRENAGRRVVLGMLLIVAGGAALAWPQSTAPGSSGAWGPLAVASACLCWAVDNNLTRSVSGSDALFLAAAKGLAAGVVNTLLALALGATLPAPPLLGAALLLGLLGYGVSLVLFVLALRDLGSARTGAYFSTAPFVGALISVLLYAEPLSVTLCVAALFMGAGVWLHVTERHDHEHLHEPLAHSHVHVHDEHHQHEHDRGWDGTEPHAHPHVHAALRHSHPHYPDIHHRHTH